jgi:hypothetical protein
LNAPGGKARRPLRAQTAFVQKRLARARFQSGARCGVASAGPPTGPTRAIGGSAGHTTVHSNSFIWSRRWRSCSSVRGIPPTDTACSIARVIEPRAPCSQDIGCASTEDIVHPPSHKVSVVEIKDLRDYAKTRGWMSLSNEQKSHCIYDDERPQKDQDSQADAVDVQGNLPHLLTHPETERKVRREPRAPMDTRPSGLN